MLATLLTVTSEKDGDPVHWTAELIFYIDGRVLMIY
jgi:hypothetical protein